MESCLSGLVATGLLILAISHGPRHARSFLRLAVRPLLHSLLTSGFIINGAAVETFGVVSLKQIFSVSPLRRGGTAESVLFHEPHQVKILRNFTTKDILCKISKVRAHNFGSDTQL